MSFTNYDIWLIQSEEWAINRNGDILDCIIGFFMQRVSAYLTVDLIQVIYVIYFKIAWFVSSFLRWLLPRFAFIGVSPVVAHRGSLEFNKSNSDHITWIILTFDETQTRMTQRFHLIVLIVQPVVNRSNYPFSCLMLALQVRLIDTKSLYKDIHSVLNVKIAILPRS